MLRLCFVSASCEAEGPSVGTPPAKQVAPTRRDPCFHARTLSTVALQVIERCAMRQASVCKDPMSELPLYRSCMRGSPPCELSNALEFSYEPIDLNCFLFFLAGLSSPHTCKAIWIVRMTVALGMRKQACLLYVCHLSLPTDCHCH